jgi:hypothetical protein
LYLENQVLVVTFYNFDIGKKKKEEYFRKFGRYLKFAHKSSLLKKTAIEKLDGV